MKTKFYSDDDLLLKKTLELFGVKLLVQSVFSEGNKYYPQIFLDDCLYKLGGWDTNVGVW